MSAAPRRCSISASRRWPPPAPALPGPSARPTTTSPSTTSAIISPRSARRSIMPVNADFEGGFAHEPDKVGVNVARAVKTGVAGLSIEDSTGDNAKPLYRSRARGRAHQGGAQGDRCRQQRRAADRPLRGVSARRRPDLKLVIDRLTAYAEAGADCLYAPGITTREDIAAVVKAVHPKPVNLLVGASGLSLKEAGDLGVRRISVGGSLARTAWAGFMKASKEMAEQGHVHRTRQRLSRRRTQQDVQLELPQKKAPRASCARGAVIVDQLTLLRPLLARPAASAGLVHIGARRGRGVAGRAGAAPVVVPGSLLAAGRHVTHARRRGGVGRLRLRGLAGRRGAGLVHAGVVQAIEQRRPAPRRWRPRTSRPWRRWRGLRRARDRAATRCRDC